MNHLNILVFFLFISSIYSCDPCYSQRFNENCPVDEIGKDSYTLHMAVHPHLDAFWIFDFDSYYDPKPHQGNVHSYFMSNRFTSVKNIFSITKDVLWESKNIRQKISNKTQQAHRSFFNSEMCFFKRWYGEQNQGDKQKVRQLLKTKYWEILGGGFVQHDEGCAYYDDIIENFQVGLNFLKTQFNYYPKTAISADSFGHSQSTLAILAHLGVEGFFVQRSDQHILLQNKTQFIWKAKSTNGKVYGALPTHIRWAIHGFEDQFIGQNVNEQFCSSKQNFVNNLRNQNKFLKRILHSNHIMRYFGHDFQKFDNYSYSVIESMMKKFSMQKCNKVTAVYGNPTEYFITLMSEVFGKNIKPIVTRSQDIFPIWDYDSGLYWTGYYTTDAYHKKSYRDLGRLLHGARKIFVNSYVDQPNTDRNKKYYQLLEEVAQQVSYLQHHDGISGTSKYQVMDKLQKQNQQLQKKVVNGIISDAFTQQFPLGTTAPNFDCHLGKTCKIPSNNAQDIYLKVINTDGSPVRDPIIVQVPIGSYYEPDCPYQVNCFCHEDICPCKLYLYEPLYTFTSIKLRRISAYNPQFLNKLKPHISNQEYRFNSTHFTISVKGKLYSIGYKKVVARGTPRHYDHLSRYGTQYSRQFHIRPGKYALGNDPNQISDFSNIKKVSKLESKRGIYFLVQWNRYQMKTLISIYKSTKNQFKVETIASTQAYYLSDLYFEVITPIQNQNKFVTDSNGWLTVQRQLFKHQDYQAFFSNQKYDDLDGNSYPATAFTYIKDQNDKVSVNLDRPQGVVAYRPGTIWINFDRLSEDDGKWVYQNAYRSQYQKYTHIITVQNTNNNERKIQRQYDQPLFIQGNAFSPNERVQQNTVDGTKRNAWNDVSNLDQLKFSIRPFNDSRTILRVHNLNDSETITVGLFADKISPILTTYYGRTVSFDQIEETSLGGNMPYSKFVNEKWNWNNVIDLRQQNSIFDKAFRENITLRPLEIRTFSFKNLKFSDQCSDVKDLKYTNTQINYALSTTKQAPSRQPIAIKIEQEVIKYNQKGDRCNGMSPIMEKTFIQTDNKKQAPQSTIFEPRPMSKPNPVIAQNDPVTEVNYKPVSANTDRPSPNIQTQTSTQNQPQTQKKYPTKEQSSSQNQSPTREEPLTFQQISQKINRRIELTKSQKQFYFSAKLSQIRTKLHKISSIK